MPVQDKILGPIPTTPDNTDQKPVFGSIIETTKDAFLLELRHYMNTRYTGVRSGELPRIDKYSVAVDVSTDPLETAVNLIRSYPDITEDMPLIAVMSTTGQNFKLGISDKFVRVAVPPAQIVGGVGPFTLSDGQDLTVTTYPNGIALTSRFKFPAFMFVDITHATVDEIVSAINIQALYLTAVKVYDGTSTKIALRAGGPRATQFPNKIDIVDGTAITALGFTQGQTSQNYGTGHVAYSRNCLSANLTVALEVVAESDNIRTELSDLLFDFFTFVMADRQFQFYGRSMFDINVQDETYQIIIRDNEIALSGEQEMPRPNDPKDKIYVNRVNVPVTTIQYTDRIIVDKSGQSMSIPRVYQAINSDSLPEPN
jgi:hypothetical protein